MSEVWDEMAVVGRVARAHGHRGQVIVDPETDFLEERFRVGAVYYARRADRMETLTVTAVRFQRGRPIVGFAEVGDMNAAEALAGAELRILTETLYPLPGDSYYRHDLVGCAVRSGAGDLVGHVRAVEGPPTQSHLVVAGVNGDILIPLAREICVGVDMAARTIVVAPLEGLLDLNERAAKVHGR